MSKKILVGLLISLMSINTLYADIENGEELFDDASCLVCHETSDFKTREHKINSIQKLHNAVAQCAFNNDITWFDDETTDVVDFLNYKHYKLQKIPIE